LGLNRTMVKRTCFEIRHWTSVGSRGTRMDIEWVAERVRQIV
jgi:hypothetical protein